MCAADGAWGDDKGKLALSNQGGVCGLMQQRSFGVRRFDVNRHERSVTWCYAESSLTNCHLETGVRPVSYTHLTLPTILRV